MHAHKCTVTVHKSHHRNASKGSYSNYQLFINFINVSLCFFFTRSLTWPEPFFFCLQLLKIISGHNVQLSVINISGITTASSASQRFQTAIYLVKLVFRCGVFHTQNSFIAAMALDKERPRWCAGTTLFWAI